MGNIIIDTPISDETIMSLDAGEMVFLSGKIYTARDAAHKILAEMIEAGDRTPDILVNQVIYYAGPAPTPPGKPIGSIGPTTSGRMDKYSGKLIEYGIKCMVGKGTRSPEVVEKIKKHNGIYFAAIGGAAALMSKCVVSEKMVLFPELGTEAVRELTIVKLPAVVAVDCRGNCVYDR